MDVEASRPIWQAEVGATRTMIDRTKDCFDLPNTVFAFDPDADEYTCPGGNKLKKYWREIGKARPAYGKDGFRKYYASTNDRGGCELKARCTPNQATRKISRHRHAAARDKVRAFAGTDAYLESMRRRKKVEMLFAHLKRILHLGRLRLRGPNGVKDEFHLAVTAQILRKLAKLLPDGPKAA